MAEKSEKLPIECTLFKERIVKISEANEFLAIGIDPVSFAPIIRICKTDGEKTAYVTSPLETYRDFVTYLECKMDGGGWAYDCSNRSELSLKSITDKTVHIKSRSEEVVISIEAAEQLDVGYIELDRIISEYIRGYQSCKKAIKEHQMKSYRRHFEEYFSEAKKCGNLCKYLGIESD